MFPLPRKWRHLLIRLVVCPLHHPSLPDVLVSPPGTINHSIDSEPFINLDQLQFFYTNADQFINKRDDLVALIAGNEPDLILITEITPKAHCTTISKCLLEIPGFSTFFNFDPDSSSSMDNIRGVGIYVSNFLQASEAHFYDPTFIEHVWVTIQLRGSDALTVGCIYRSPSHSIEQTTSDLCDLLSAIPRSSHCLVCGDFNYGNINWESHCQLLPVNTHTQLFLDTLSDLFWTQHVTEPSKIPTWSISSYFGSRLHQRRSHD